LDSIVVAKLEEVFGFVFRLVKISSHKGYRQEFGEL